jgi:dihydroorotate dehydrogenase electron transfer subunit
VLARSASVPDLNLSNGVRLTVSPRRTLARLVERRRLAEEHFVITLGFEGPREFLPGQFAMLRGPWDRDPLLGRPLAILGAGEAGWDFYFRVVGRGTARMATDPLGSEYELVGPLGRPFELPRGEAWICAGGIGVASVLPLAKAALAAGLPCRAFFGARDAAGLCLAGEFGKIPCELATDDGSVGYHGRVTDLMARALPARPGEATVYACGPELMMAAAAGVCREAGVPCKVSLEAPMACGFGVCLGCSRDLAGGRILVCQAGPCLDASEVYGRPGD